jgi:hypothetical protein
MSDLRTRIAAAIERSLVAQFPSDLPDRYGEWIENDTLADAVIRELRLREERRGPVTAYSDGQYYPDSSIVRVISDWGTRDE